MTEARAGPPHAVACTSQVSQRWTAKPEGCGQRRGWKGAVLGRPSAVSGRKAGRGVERGEGAGPSPMARLLQSVPVGGGRPAGCVGPLLVGKCGESSRKGLCSNSLWGPAHTESHTMAPDRNIWGAFARKCHLSPCLPPDLLVVKRKPVAATEGTKQDLLTGDEAADRGTISQLERPSPVSFGEGMCWQRAVCCLGETHLGSTGRGVRPMLCKMGHVCWRCGGAWVR